MLLLLLLDFFACDHILAQVVPIWTEQQQQQQLQQQQPVWWWTNNSFVWMISLGQTCFFCKRKNGKKIIYPISFEVLKYVQNAFLKKCFRLSVNINFDFISVQILFSLIWQNSWQQQQHFSTKNQPRFFFAENWANEFDQTRRERERKREMLWNQACSLLIECL